MLKRVLLLAAVAVASVSGSARADITVDNFTVPSPALPYALGGPVGSTAVIPNALPTGASRVITVTQTANASGAIGATKGVIGLSGTLGNVFTLNTEIGTTANASLLYTYATAQNLSAGGTILRLALNTDLGVPVSVRVGNGSTTITQVQTVGVGFSGILSFDLTGFGSVSTSVRSIEVLLNTNTTNGASSSSADLALTDIRITTPPPPAVPAPVGLVLLLAAAPALGLARRFARKA